MSKAAHPQPPHEDFSPLDPVDEELVAYLDGELSEEQAKQVEQRLASDPQLRRRAILLKKTYDLLDYLPRPEASPDFTTRTLEKVPPFCPSSSLSPPSQGPCARPSVIAHPSTSDPLVLSPSSVTSQRTFVTFGHPFFSYALLFFIFVAAAALGYTFTAKQFPSPRSSHTPVIEPSLADHRLIQMLPFYIGVDDLAFLLRLAEPDYFGDDPLLGLVDNGNGRRTPTTAEWEPPPASWEDLLNEYKRLPPSRQLALQELDRELFAQEPADREYLLQILEAYAFWLSKLSEKQRNGILGAPDAAQRLQKIRELREQQWLESLPTEQQKRLRTLSTPERIELVRRLKRHESDRREAWSFVRRHAEEIAANRIPWPFHDEALRKSVIEFARSAFRLDEPDKARLTANDHNRYLALLHQAEQSGGWNWFYYGREVYNLTRKYERFLLPEPQGKPITDLADLGASARYFEKGRALAFVQPHRGKWPEFALAVHDYWNSLSPLERPRIPPLGPARLSEFREPLRRTIEQELWPKLRPQDFKALDNLEGKWPEYCRELRKWAWFYDISLPGLMLPGSPRQWDAWYGPKPAPPSIRGLPLFPLIPPRN